MHQLTQIPTKGQIRKILPQTAAKYGVIFGTNGEYDYEVEMRKIGNFMPKTLDVAVLQILQFEAHFAHLNVSGHLVDLATGQEIRFERTAPYTITTQVIWSLLEPSLN